MQRQLIAGSCGLATLLLIIAITTVAVAEPLPPDVGRSPLSPPQMGATTWLPAPPIETQSQIPNLLVNGNFDELPFYWASPNHHIAGGWLRWWIHGTVLPEYDDARDQRPYYDGGHAQVYFKWGHTYEAGIYQVVSGLTPCTPYRFTMWARNHSLEGVLPHARIGLDPEGTQLTSGPDEGAVPRPPGLPPRTVWSREQTVLFKWEQLSVEAEPLGNRLTAILYAHPEPPPDGRTYYFDTYWDAGRLITGTYPGGRMPEPVSWTPSGFITNVTTSTVLNALVIEWDTPAPASTQVWYTVITSTAPITFTGAFTVYLPLVMGAPQYAHATALDATPVTRHRAVIGGLQNGQIVRFVALSRRAIGGACVTEVSEPMEVTISGIPPLNHVYLPAIMKEGDNVP